MKLLVAINNVLPGLPSEAFIEVENTQDIRDKMAALDCPPGYIDRVCKHVSDYFEAEYRRALEAQNP